MIGVIETKISDVVEKIRKIEVDISAEKGDFTLFALIQREESFGKWDIVVSADWIKEKEILNLIALKLRQNLTESEQLLFSRIVVLQPSDAFVRSLNLINIEHGNAKLTNNSFNGIYINEAYLITSKIR